MRITAQARVHGQLRPARAHHRPGLRVERLRRLRRQAGQFRRNPVRPLIPTVQDRMNHDHGCVLKHNRYGMLFWTYTGTRVQYPGIQGIQIR